MSAPNIEYPHSNPDLTFHDADLTDHYPPSRTSSASSRAHPTGDSPPSQHRSRRHSSSSNSTAVSRSLAWSPVSAGSQAGAMPNLSELLDFLDEDEHHQHEEEKEEGEATPRRVNGAGGGFSSEEEGFRASGAQVPSSSTPRRLQSSLDSARARSVSVSPSHQPAHLAPSAQHQSYNQSAYNRSAASSFTLNPIPLPSPSPPPPPPVASQRLHTTNGAHSSSRSLGPSPSLHASAGGRSSSYSPNASSRQSRRYDESDGSHLRGRADMVAQMADEVMAEFSAIVSTPPAGSSSANRPRTPNGTEQPPSRLPRLVTPTSPTFDDPPQSYHHQPTSLHNTSHHYSPHTPHQSTTSHAQPPPPPEEREHTPAEVNWVASELKEANRVIAHLQGELKTIREMVGRLKVEDVVPPSESAGREGVRVSGVQSAAREYDADDSAEQHHHSVKLDSHPAAWEIAKHLHALLPSPASPHPSAAALDSLSLSLAFTRSVDALAHQLAPGKYRRDEDVFERSNLESVLGRVKGWENVVRR